MHPISCTHLPERTKTKARSRHPRPHPTRPESKYEIAKDIFPLLAHVTVLEKNKIVTFKMDWLHVKQHTKSRQEGRRPM